MRVLLVNNDGQKDIRQLVTSITWSGEYQQAARTLEVGIAVSPHDSYLPREYIALGSMLKLLDDKDVELFRGYVFSKQKSYQGTEMAVTAYDGLIYLTKSQMSYNFQNMTPEAITRKVCSDLGVPPGNIASTGINLSYIARGKTGNDIILTVYTQASRQNGKKYMLQMNQGKLDVIEKGSITAHFVLDNAINLTNSTYSETLDNMVNRIVIVDETGKPAGKVENAEWMQSYGLIQSIYQKEQGKDPTTVANSLLQGVERKAGIEALGNTECITGRAIKITEAYTGLTGLFYIDADTHTWSEGKHQMNLTVEWQNMMDEREG